MATRAMLPSEYGYVVLVLVLYCFLNFWMTAQVGKARKKYVSFTPHHPQILFFSFYPTLYASQADNKDANLFNCIQRGHQNSLELMPIYFMLMILGGIKHPLVSAAFGLLYIVSRYFYFTGYATGDPVNRLKIGKFLYLALLGLIICTISLGFSLVRA